MEKNNITILLPEDLIITLDFVEQYRKTYQENLNSQEFMITKSLEGNQDIKKDYSKLSEAEASHPFNKDLDLIRYAIINVDLST